MKSNAVWVVAEKKIEIRPVECGSPKYDEVQIETKACGVCAWDSYLYRGMSAPGPIPYVIGHEAVGIVREVGEGVKGFKPGDKVFCSSGGNAMMQQFFNQHYSCIAKIPEDVTDYASWVLEPTTCVVNLLKLSQLEPGDSVALVGAGYMGLLTLQGLTRGSCAGDITVFEIRKGRIALAEKLCPGHVYDPDSEEGKSKIDQMIKNGGVDVVIDFAASDSGYDLALKLRRYNAGKLVLGTWHRHEKTFDGTNWHMSGLNVLNLSPMSNRHYTDMIPRTAALVRRGVYTPGELVSHVAHYEDVEAVNALFQKSIDKSDCYMKGVILF